MMAARKSLAFGLGTTPLPPRHPAFPGDAVVGEGLPGQELTEYNKKWMTPMERLQEEVVACRRCPRLVKHREQVAREKRRAYQDWEYWGKPLPSFGDPRARLLVLGLAPAAHGGNRTGRMFTGDRSGDFLYHALWRAGFANQPTARRRDDGLKLGDCYITASLRCAPPANKPARKEMENCRPYLARELELLKDVRVVVALGKIAFDSYLTVLKEKGVIASRAPYRFGHGAFYRLPGGGPALLASYHPSQQNTFTGKLTREMLRSVFVTARTLIGDGR